MSFDRNDPADLAALKSEATNDPQGIGYTVLTDGNTGKFLDEVNAKNYTVDKPQISSDKVKDLTTFAAFDGLLAPEQSWLQWQADRSGDGENMLVTAELRQKLAGDPEANDSIWAVSERAEMNAAMLALMNVPGSRAEVLWGYGSNISRDDWFAARDS